MKYSIIIPAHNSADYIDKALDSIDSQTYKDYELIVVCDACTDRTEHIAKSSIRGNSTDKVITVDYNNIGLTRNAGIDVARGEYILFMDDDDWWLHEFVLEQIDQAIRGADVLCFGFIWKYRGYTSPHRDAKTVWPAVWNKCWKRTAIGVNRFPDKFPEDVLFNAAVFKRSLDIKFLEMPLYYYNYWREGSYSRRTGQTDLRIIKE